MIGQIRQPALMGLSGVLLLGLAIYCCERMYFLSHAEHTSGTVSQITARNSRCGGKHKHACTRFSATVSFTTKKGDSASLDIGAGDSYGYDKPISYARLKQSQPVPVVYDPNNPKKAYEDTIWGIWTGPIFLFVFQISTFFGSFREPRRRYRSY